jgi:hypothetical protein
MKDLQFDTKAIREGYPSLQINSELALVSFCCLASSERKSSMSCK